MKASPSAGPAFGDGEQQDCWLGFGRLSGGVARGAGLGLLIDRCGKALLASVAVDSHLSLLDSLLVGDPSESSCRRLLRGLRIFSGFHPVTCLASQRRRFPSLHTSSPSILRSTGLFESTSRNGRGGSPRSALQWRPSRWCSRIGSWSALARDGSSLSRGETA